MTTCILHTIWTCYVASNRISVSKILISLRTGLPAFDTKRWPCENTDHTHSHGHKDTVSDPSNSQIWVSTAAMICLEQHHWLRVQSDLEIRSSDELSQAHHLCQPLLSLNCSVIQQQLSELNPILLVEL